jgi:ATP-dependent Clp protease protease subunit
MIHQPSSGFSGTTADIEISAQQALETRRSLDQLLADHTGQPVARINKDTDRDFYMGADAAKAYGIVDDILKKHN